MSEEYNYCYANARHSTSPRKLNMSFVSDQLAGFEKLRISALTNAAEISPQVTEVTIGPNSPLKKEISNFTRKEEYKENVDNNAYASKKDTAVDKLQSMAVMKTFETKLHDENSEVIFKNLIDKMIAKRAEFMKQYWVKQSEDCEVNASEFKARKQQMIRELHDNDNLTLMEKVKQSEQHTQYINTKTIENMNRVLEEQNRAAARFASITNSHTKICICYNEIVTVLQSDEYAYMVNDKYVLPINSIVANINKVMDCCKNGNISDKEVKQAEIFALNIENIKRMILSDISELRNQDLLRKHLEEEQTKQQEIEAQKEKERVEAELKKETLQIKQTIATQQSKPMYYSAKNYMQYKTLKKYLLTYENSFKDLLEDPSLKKFRFDCQKAVNTPVNAISSVSGQHIKDKYIRLTKLLVGERVQTSEAFIMASQHPQGIAYCTALLAKKIVRQGDWLVSSKPEAAFPLAAVTVALRAQFPDFGKLLEAYFHKECPYLVPMLLPQKEGMTDKEFYQSRGYKYNDEGDVEKQDKFLKRMSGIFRLSCALWITPTPKFINASNDQGFSSGWKWLTSFINLKPEPDICPTLLYDFFTVCGSEFYQHYGLQFIKIVKVISTDYLSILTKMNEGGPQVRLEELLRNIINTNHIPSPNGLLPANTW